MGNILTIPDHGSRRLSNRDVIISILGKDWPLTAKQIYKTAKKEYAVSASYQAVHKMLSELFVEHVVAKTDLGYSLDSNWIKKIKLFSDQLDRSYSMHTSKGDLQNHEIFNFYFDNFIQTIRFIIHNFYDDFPNPDNKPDICMMRHAVLPIGATDNDWSQMKKIFSKPYYGLYSSNTLLDKFANNITISLGKKSIDGVSYPAEGDLVIRGDYIAQIFYPVDFKRKLDDFFHSFKSIDQFNMANAFELYSQRNIVKVVISRNYGLTKSLREEAINLYLKNVNLP